MILSEIYSPRPDRYVIYTTTRPLAYGSHQMVGGLADRIKGILTCFTIAVATQRKFLINWSAPFTLEPILGPNIIDWRMHTHGDSLRSEDITCHLDLMGNKFDNFIKQDDLDGGLLGGQSVVYVTTNLWSPNRMVELIPTIKNFDKFVHTAFGYLFKIQVPSAVAPELEAITRHQASGQPVLGVHMRTGGDGQRWSDPLQEPWDFASRSVQDSVHLSGLDPSKILVLFIADDARAKDLVAKTKFPFPVLIPHGPLAHIDRQSVTRADFDQALGEFLLLGKCDMVIGGMGGYGQLAALVAGRPFSRRKLDVEA